MTLRIRFTDSDLRQVRMAQGPDPLWEAVLAAHLLQTRDGPLIFGAWRRDLRGRLDGGLRQILALAPPLGYSPDFLTPAEASHGLEAGLEAVLRLPRERLRAELAQLPPHRRGLPWISALADGTPAVLERLAAGLAAFHREAVEPHRAQIESQLAAERARLAGELLSGGIDRMLGSLHPAVRWQPPVLEVVTGPFDRELPLAGRGLVLLPSFFCWGSPTVLRDPELPPVLVYPLGHELRPISPAAAGTPAREIAALIGRTRAALLAETAVGRGTGELARRVGISPASASEHLRTLREAGLVLSRREGNRVVHELSPLGQALLEGRPY